MRPKLTCRYNQTFRRRYWPDIQRRGTGFIARVALFEGTWEKARGDAAAAKYIDAALTASLAVINSGTFIPYTPAAARKATVTCLLKPATTRKKRYLTAGTPVIFLVMMHALYVRSGMATTLPVKWLICILIKMACQLTNQAVFHGYSTFTSEFEDRDPRMTKP
jgi:hypothetical protein